MRAKLHSASPGSDEPPAECSPSWSHTGASHDTHPGTKVVTGRTINILLSVAVILVLVVICVEYCVYLFEEQTILDDTFHIKFKRISGGGGFV